MGTNWCSHASTVRCARIRSTNCTRIGKKRINSSNNCQCPRTWPVVKSFCFVSISMSAVRFAIIAYRIVKCVRISSACIPKDLVPPFIPGIGRDAESVVSMAIRTVYLSIMHQNIRWKNPKT